MTDDMLKLAEYTLSRELDADEVRLLEDNMITYRRLVHGVKWADPVTMDVLEAWLNQLFED